MFRMHEGQRYDLEFDTSRTAAMAYAERIRKRVGA
jgi:chloramphenicol 3-O-phosphotransferase